MNFSGIYKRVLVPKLNYQSLLEDRFAIELKVARGFSRKGSSSCRHRETTAAARAMPSPCPPPRTPRPAPSLQLEDKSIPEPCAALSSLPVPLSHAGNPSQGSCSPAAAVTLATDFGHPEAGRRRHRLRLSELRLPAVGIGLGGPESSCRRHLPPLGPAADRHDCRRHRLPPPPPSPLTHPW